ncbi:MAG: histone deacetylase family protein [Desulfobacterota bacterium]|nr:histone deacetylase family protein [Thermodesulfobacteriota bacterium]
MKVVFHEAFYRVYSSDPAAASGRLEPIVAALGGMAEFITAEPASQENIQTVHTTDHIEDVKAEGVYDIAVLAAGGAIQAARIGLSEPAFGLIRPPGHHASRSSAWGFCYFNNMAIALVTLKQEGSIRNAFVLDIDLHYGDGTVNILGGENWVEILNPQARSRAAYYQEVKEKLEGIKVDLIGVSAGFDHHVDDWGGLLTTEDYATIGALVRQAAKRCGGGCFAILEGGYNHSVLGKNVAAFMKGMMYEEGMRPL